MKNLKGACIFAQSGGPTAVINASAAGVFTEALKQPQITNVYGAAYGIKGVLEERLFDISKESREEIELLKYTPSSALGSVRYKLKDFNTDSADYNRLLEVFKKYDVRFFFYNGGNDSMDTCNKISKFFERSGWDCNVIGVPKTIDNDLFGTDHTPGFGSAAKYIATTVMELTLDVKVYDMPSVCIIETMGRNAGWLTAASALAGVNGLAPDLIYLPESVFDLDKFVTDIERVCAKNNGQCVAVVSEGVHDENGVLLCESQSASFKDCFGHTQLGGIAANLSRIVKKRTGFKTRGIELSLMQRCSAHVASKADVDEAFNAGAAAVMAAVNGETDKMIIYERETPCECKNAGGGYDCGACENYKINYKTVDLSLAANAVKVFPQKWIINNETYVSDEFIKYALPLIQGDAKAPLENGLPRYAKLKKVLVKR